MRNERQLFENAFPLPDNIVWSEEHQQYGYAQRRQDLNAVHRYRSMWKVWQKRAALEVRSRPTVEIRQVNDGFALYEAERLVRGGFDRRHTAILWAVDQGLGVKV